MKSLSYLIIVMSLIGNCPSAKAFYDQNKIKFCPQRIAENITSEDAKQLLEDYHFFLSQRHIALKKSCYNAPSNKEFAFSSAGKSTNQNDCGYHLKLHHKTSVIRNKNDLLI
ncbi:MAG: hypothetical protein J0I53_00735 [Chryseobacterium sp.]|nr:hypothetical protein [Chryseobacterium sp.]